MSRSGPNQVREEPRGPRDPKNSFSLEKKCYIPLKGPKIEKFQDSGKDHLGCSSMCWLSWFSGPGFCSCPGFHLSLGASDCSPGLAFCCTNPWTLLGSAARSSPTSHAKTGRTAHVFTAQGARAERSPSGIEIFKRD